jgi:hypothetical protein
MKFGKDRERGRNPLRPPLEGATEQQGTWVPPPLLFPTFLIFLFLSLSL